jgi:hypothetical protein
MLSEVSTVLRLCTLGTSLINGTEPCFAPWPENDVHSQALNKACDKRGVRFKILDRRVFAQNGHISSDDSGSFYLSVNGSDLISSKECCLLISSEPNLHKFYCTDSLIDRKLGLEAFLSIIPEQRSMNGFKQSFIARNKQFHFQIAYDYAIPVIPYIITCDRTSAITFLDKCISRGSKVVVKDLIYLTVKDFKEKLIPFTPFCPKILRKQLLDLPSADFDYRLFLREFWPKNEEWRVFFIDEKIFPFVRYLPNKSELNYDIRDMVTTVDRQLKTDLVYEYRRDFDSVLYTKIQLYMKKLQLRKLCVEFIPNKEGILYALDFNSEFAFLDFEQKCEVPLSDIIIGSLVGF